MKRLERIRDAFHLRLGLLGAAILVPGLVHAQDELNSGDTAWMLVASALVLL